MPRSVSLPARMARSSRVTRVGLIIMLAMALLPFLPAQPVAAASGAITVEHYLCPPEVDFAGGAFGDLNAACLTPVADDAFTLQPNGGAAAMQNTNASGTVSWASSDPGDGSITRVNVGSAETRVFCSVHEEGEVGTILESTVAAGAISYSIPDGQLMDCVWFSYEPALLGSEIRLNKWSCPDDFDIEAAGTIDELWASCTAPLVGAPFARVPDGGDPVELLTDAAGAITWPQFPSGTGFVAETAAEMTLSRVFCTPYDIGVIGVATYNEVDATGNQIAYDLAAGKGLDCEWFNYVPAADTSDVVVYKRACPEGDWSAATLDDLTNECTDFHTDVDFVLSNPSTGLQGTTDAAGAVGWTVPSGDSYTVTEVTPDGYGKARIFCSNYDQNSGPGEYTEMDTPGNEIAATLDVGYSLECYWFNVPAQLGTIVVDKYACPEGYGIGTGYDQLASNCTAPVNGVTFTLTPAGLSGITGQTDNSGRVVFESVPLGEGTLGEQVPQQYNWVEVYCAIADDVAAGPYQGQNITSSNLMGYLMEPSQVWSCSWFNLQVDPGPASLTINKYTCQSAHDPVEPNQTLANECAEPTEDITFTLENDATSMSASTGTGGAPATISFSELEPGTYLLTEDIPDSVQLAYIGTCSSDVRTFSYPFSPFAIIEPEGRISIDLLPGEDLECDWYNCLAETPGTITSV
ncbi:MAG: collagen binding domain-containing protein, partial [Thermomicrobiales bacterium]